MSKKELTEELISEKLEEKGIAYPGEIDIEEGIKDRKLILCQIACQP